MSILNHRTNVATSITRTVLLMLGLNKCKPTKNTELS